MTTLPESGVRLHRESHAELVDLPNLGGDWAPIDAIVVPMARSAGHILPVAALARRLDCHLVVLCSVQSRAGVVANLLANLAPLRAVVVDLPDNYQHELLQFETSRHHHAGLRNHVDLSNKRNIGLLLARLLGWKQVLFVDDDIVGLSVRQVAWASSLLYRYSIAGFRVDNYPDNSVVCHAHRLGGGSQEVFLAANALLVHTAVPQSFFPAIYNEDWLFLFDSLKARTVAAAGRTWQLPYDPFQSPTRAELEEFGDTVAEGLLWLIHEGRNVSEADSSFWRNCLARRSTFIENVADRILAMDQGDGATENTLAALKAAKERLADIYPGDCQSFIQAWRMDLAEWTDRISILPSCSSIRKALHHLGLQSVSLEVT
jgi:hypothetical protein